MLWFSEIENHDAIDAAITVPTPSTEDSSSLDAEAIASSVPKYDDNESAAAGPRCLIPTAVSNLGRGFVRDA